MEGLISTNEDDHIINQQLKNDKSLPTPSSSHPTAHSLPPPRPHQFQPNHYSQHVSKSGSIPSTKYPQDIDQNLLAIDHMISTENDLPAQDSNTTTIPQIAVDEAIAYTDTTDTSLLHAPPTPLLSPPKIRPIDKVNSSVPSKVSLNWDLLQKSVGFMNMKLVLNHIKDITQDTVVVNDLSRNPIKDRGEIATLPKKKRNTKRTPRPTQVGNVIHYDIAHGTGYAIGGIRYVLVLIDKATNHLYEYGLKTLKPQSLLIAMKQFINDLGCKPQYMRADRDFKLIGGEVASFLETPTVQNGQTHTTQVAGAPEGRQNQNGLIESHWKKVMTLARAWLTSNLLPTKFWYFAVKQAVQVCNYTPIYIQNTWTTAFEQMYKIKPDYRNLIPLFSLAYVKRNRDGTTHRTKAMSQTLRCICVGNDSKSDGLLFFSPDFKSLIRSAYYALGPIPPSGPICNLSYDGGGGYNLTSCVQEIPQNIRLHISY